MFSTLPAPTGPTVSAVDLLKRHSCLFLLNSLHLTLTSFMTVSIKVQENCLEISIERNFDYVTAGLVSQITRLLNSGVTLWLFDSTSPPPPLTHSNPTSSVYELSSRRRLITLWVFILLFWPCLRCVFNLFLFFSQVLVFLFGSSCVFYVIFGSALVVFKHALEINWHQLADEKR